MEIILAWFVICLSVLLGAVHYYLTRNFNYWKNRNIVGPKPIPFFGTFKDVTQKKIHLADFLKTVYDRYPKDPVVGLFERTKPLLLIKDPDMVKDVLISNFVTFPNRGIKFHPDIEPFAQNLFFLNYESWRPLRLKLTPGFSSGKLKEMFNLIDDCTQNFVEYLGNLVEKDEPIECRELAAKLATDVIGVCAFGLNLNSMEDKESMFRKIEKTFRENSWTNKLRYVSRALPHWLAILIKPFAHNRQAYDFFHKIVIQTMEYRKKNNIKQNDFIDSLIVMRENAEQLGEERMPDSLLISQAFAFFIGGTDAPSTVISTAMYELAFNPTIQDTLRKEIVTVTNKNGGKLNYESLKNMKYLDKVLQETLRKYPPAVILPRMAEKDHTFEKYGISISKGTKLYVPVYALHHDPKIYPNPEKFDPGRFDDEVVRSRPRITYLPFGDGPRTCIGDRFTNLQMKICLAAAVKNFKFEVCDKTCRIYKKKLGTILIVPQNGVYLTVKKI